MSILTNFINGLRKSFDGKDYLRNIPQCDQCGKPSFCVTCQFCETNDAYRRNNKKDVR
jgi:hypothetical protein